LPNGVLALVSLATVVSLWTQTKGKRRVLVSLVRGPLPEQTSFFCPSHALVTDVAFSSNPNHSHGSLCSSNRVHAHGECQFGTPSQLATFYIVWALFIGSCFYSYFGSIPGYKTLYNIKASQAFARGIGANDAVGWAVWNGIMLGLSVRTKVPATSNLQPRRLSSVSFLSSLRSDSY
jgi:hypothetical protein